MAFSGCSALRSIVIPTGVTKIGEYAFSRCELLTEVIIPQNVTFIGQGAFFECSNLANVIFEVADGWYYSNFNTIEDGKPFSVSDIADPQKAATYIKGKYYTYHWIREQ